MRWLSVQLENGYTRVANELLEQVILYKLNASQLKNSANNY